MSFVGFIFQNDQVREASAHVADTLQVLFESATSLPEDTARVVAVTRDVEATSARTIVDTFKSLKDIVVVNEDKMEEGLHPHNLIAGSSQESALSKSFMDSCLSFDPHYLTTRDCEDIYAAFTQRKGDDLLLTMVSLDAIEHTHPSAFGVPAEDVTAAIKAAPAYMNSLKGSIYSAAQDASFEQHAARALNRPEFKTADVCHLRVIACDDETGKPVDRRNTTVQRGEYASSFEYTSHAQRQRLGQLGHRR